MNNRMNFQKKLQACRGMKDLIGLDSLWHHEIITHIFEQVEQYGYEKIQTPFLESRELFVRAVGDQTDVVQKEMFSFQHDDDSEILTLRPEGTAGCVRAGIEHGLFRHKIKRWAYSGAMFRRERPQKGRYRQFHQFGIELFGLKGLGSTLEIFLITSKIFQSLKLRDHLILEINTLGTESDRKTYAAALIDYFEKALHEFPRDIQQRAALNPLRLLDSKDNNLQKIINNAPKLKSYLTAESQKNFEALQCALRDLDIKFAVSDRLVRGLDYYNDVVFEWTSAHLGAQSTVCGGGRYDRLVEAMQGPSTPAVGCAFGIERLIILMQAVTQWDFKKKPCRALVVGDVQIGLQRTIEVAEAIRQQYPNWDIAQFYEEPLIRQFKCAESLGYDWAIVIKKDLHQGEVVALRNLHDRRERMVGDLNSILSYLHKEQAS